MHGHMVVWAVSGMGMEDFQIADVGDQELMVGNSLFLGHGPHASD